MKSTENVIELRGATQTNAEQWKTALTSPTIPNLDAIKAKQKATWESGDFGRIAEHIETVAEEFMSRMRLRHGLQVLDVACGTGNLAVIAARHGCAVAGVDIASNLIQQARARAAKAGFNIDYKEGDAEALPFADSKFELVVSMFGTMFAPRPGVVVEELRRVTKPGYQIAMANWTPEGFIGKMFNIFKAHMPPPPAGIPPAIIWGDEKTVTERLGEGFTNLQLTRRIALMKFSFPPAETVEFFRQYYGPTNRSFATLTPAGQEALRRDLVNLQIEHNIAKVPGTTEVAAEYLEVIATRK